MEGLIEGRIVHYVAPDGRHLPAVVVNVWDRNVSTGCCNLNVLSDYSNDSGWTSTEMQVWKDAGFDPNDVKHGHFWATSKMYSEAKEPGTWHWIEKA